MVKRLAVPESFSKRPLGSPGLAVANVSSSPSDISFYSSSPGVHFGPPDLFNH